MTKVRHNNKIVGYMVNGKLIKRDSQVVLFRKFDGWGVSEKILKEYRPTHIQLQKDGVAHQVSIEKFRRHAKKHVNDQDPSDVQWILERKYWDEKNINQGELL